jgi:hypothetical protein
MAMSDNDLHYEKMQTAEPERLTSSSSVDPQSAECSSTAYYQTLKKPPRSWTCTATFSSYCSSTAVDRRGGELSLLISVLTTPWVPLDKSEGLVKQKLSLAMRKHRCVSQRVLTTEDTGKHP